MSDLTADVPRSWEIQGTLPDEGGPPTRLLEDLFSVCTPRAEMTLDVGWTPAGDPAGAYLCRFVVDDEWETPVEQWKTTDAAAVRQWIVATLEAMSDRLGREAAHPAPPVAATFKPVTVSSSATQGGVLRAA
jgi:hypothetical protein